MFRLPFLISVMPRARQWPCRLMVLQRPRVGRVLVANGSATPRRLRECSRWPMAWRQTYLSLTMLFSFCLPIPTLAIPLPSKLSNLQMRRQRCGTDDIRRRRCGADNAAPTMRRRRCGAASTTAASWPHGFVASWPSWPHGLVASWLRGLVAARGRLTSAAGPRQHQATQGAEIMHHGFKDRPIDWEDDATSVGHRFSPLKIFWKGEPIQQSQIMDRSN